MQTYLFQQVFDQTVRAFPKKEFLKFKKDSLSFEEVWQQANSLGLSLKKLGLKKGERVGIWLDKSFEQVVSILGTLYAEGVFVVLNSILHHDQALHIINDCNIKVLVTQNRKLEMITKALKDTEIEQVILTDEKTADNSFFKDLINEKVEKPLSSTCIGEDTSNIIYTSGSTGKPKGIVISHQNLIDGANIIAEYLKITDQDRLLGTLPFNFDYGLNQLLTCILKGSSLVLHTYFLPNDLLNILEKEEITGFAGIPPIWKGIFNNKLSSDKKHDLSKLRYVTNSGGKVPLPIVEKMQEFFPSTEINLMYGLTEAFRSTYLDPAEVKNRPNSIGKAIPNTEMFIVNDKGEECQPNEKGELVHRGACIAKGYWNDPEKTKAVYKPNPLLKENSHLETVVYSGDLVYKDEEGFIYFVSRKDEMIKVQGYRVSPTEVEEILLKFPGISNTVVFGVETDDDSYKIRALITTTEELKTEDITNFCKKEAPAYMVPQDIVFYEEFPKTASGKIDRSNLKKESIKEFA